MRILVLGGTVFLGRHVAAEALARGHELTLFTRGIHGAGLFLGPHDGVFRLPWWVRRIAAGGDVPAPGDPGRELQIIDARDLAAWMLDLAEQRVAGVFNGTGPAGMTTMGELLGAAVEATGSGARVRWVGDEWLRAGGEAQLSDWGSHARPAPMGAEREAELLAQVD